jgi:hypothetical protein
MDIPHIDYSDLAPRLTAPLARNRYWSCRLVTYRDGSTAAIFWSGHTSLIERFTPVFEFQTEPGEPLESVKDYEDISASEPYLLRRKLARRRVDREVFLPHCQPHPIPEKSARSQRRAAQRERRREALRMTGEGARS